MAKSESTKIEFGYFHDYESEQFAFYRIPKVLFTDEYFRNLSSDAKVLYGLMLDRMALSIRHQWFDEEGKDNADTIEGNCDTTLFLGGKEKTTLKEIAEILGKETIDLYNTSDTRGSQRSYGMNYQKTGKELMSQDEIAVMDGGKCILQVRGVRPFFSNKYDICKHKNYKYLSDYDKKNTFDIEKYLSTNLILKPEDEVELYQM